MSKVPPRTAVAPAAPRTNHSTVTATKRIDSTNQSNQQVDELTHKVRYYKMTKFLQLIFFFYNLVGGFAVEHGWIRKRARLLFQ